MPDQLFPSLRFRHRHIDLTQISIPYDATHTTRYTQPSAHQHRLFSVAENI